MYEDKKQVFMNFVESICKQYDVEVQDGYYETFECIIRKISVHVRMELKNMIKQVIKNEK